MINNYINTLEKKITNTARLNEIEKNIDRTVLLCNNALKAINTLPLSTKIHLTGVLDKIIEIQKESISHLTQHSNFIKTDKVSSFVPIIYKQEFFLKCLNRKKSGYIAFIDMHYIRKSVEQGIFDIISQELDALIGHYKDFLVMHTYYDYKKIIQTLIKIEQLPSHFNHIFLSEYTNSLSIQEILEKSQKINLKEELNNNLLKEPEELSTEAKNSVKQKTSNPPVIASQAELDNASSYEEEEDDILDLSSIASENNKEPMNPVDLFSSANSLTDKAKIIQDNQELFDSEAFQNVIKKIRATPIPLSGKKKRDIQKAKNIINNITTLINKKSSK